MDLQQLLGDGPYKEKYRKEMIVWSDAVRAETPDFFCREAFTKGRFLVLKYNVHISIIYIFVSASKSVVIVSDIRRRTDIAYFMQLARELGCRLLRVRISVDDEVRRERGWVFENGVDDVASECDLDGYVDWDVEIQNDSGRTLDECLAPVLSVIKKVL